MLPRTLTRFVALRLLSCLLIVALLGNSMAPLALAQDGAGGGDGSIYLPLISGGQGSGGPGSGLQVYRTEIEVQTAAHWQTLQRVAPVFLARGDHWAQVLVDDEQLADLARLRFNPEGTNALTTLARAAAEAEAPLPEAVLALAGQVQAAALGAEQGATEAAALGVLRSAVAAQMRALTAADLAAVAAAEGVDTDGDGLTDDQEGFWCTSVSSQDSDGDGTKDGAEVTNLKNWMNNELSQAPGTRKPFAGWPNQTTCLDDDYDSIPDQAEWTELGLRGDAESTDLDKFDDGEEVFGITKCPGGNNNCGYGDLPRSADAGFVGADMPSWVKAPGNHPLVAAFPVPEIDVLQSSLHVETVTTVTTDHVIASGTEKSYSTATTEGTSTSVANTVTWNEWQEVSDSLQQRVLEASATDPLFLHGSNVSEATGNKFTRFVGGSTKIIGGTALGVAGTGGCGSIVGTTATIGAVVGAVPGFLIGAGAGLLACGGLIVGGALLADSGVNDLTNKDDVDERTSVNQYQSTEVRLDNHVQLDNQVEVVVNQSVDTSSIVHALEGTRYTYQQTGELISNRLYEIGSILAAPVQTTSQTQGKSWGGSQTTSTERYEEHTVTNGESFSSEESWGSATAIDSTHAADLWFSYKVRNTGTEYAREITNLAFNIYIGDDPNPAYTYFVAPDIGGDSKFVNFMPDEEHSYTARRIPLSLNQMKAIDLGGSLRIVVEDYSYSSDEFFYQRALQSGVLFALEDGASDGSELIDSYLIPVWRPGETILDVLARYFPHKTDADGNLLAIWTPEYRTDNPSWCQEGWRPTDYPSKVLWCKHTLSTAEWWNVYTDGLGDGSEGFQDTQAVPGATALFRFNQDTDLDGFSDRSEISLGTDPKDASSAPRPELLGGLHSIRAGSKVTSTLSLLNRGVYDAYGVEAVMVAPDDSITIDNNTVGGSGRVRALKQVIVGSRIALPTPLPAPWLQANHAVPAAAGYFTGAADVAFTFTSTLR